MKQKMVYIKNIKMNRLVKVKELLKEGVAIPAIPLALDKNLNFDEKTQRLLVRYYLEAGAKGIAFAVHTTQFEIRDHPEIHKQSMITVIDEIKKYEKEKKEVIICISGIAGKLDNAIKEAVVAKNNGFDLLLLSPAAYRNSVGFNELLKYYREVSNILPVFGFYLQPSVGGMKLPYEFWSELFEIKNVIGAKIASFNRYETIEVLKAVADSSNYEDLIMYTGNDDHIIFDLISEYKFETKYGQRTVRFEGGLLGQWSIWTKKAVEMLEKAKIERKAGKISNELILEGLQLTEANSAVFDVENNFQGCIAGIHEVLRIQGFFDEINCFEKNGILSNGQSEKIQEVMKKYPHLVDGNFVETFLENNR